MIVPSAAVSVDWLHDALDDHHLVVLDATVFAGVDTEGRRVWISAATEFASAGHIPGARFVDQTAELRDSTVSYDLGRPSRDQFGEAMRRVGVSDDSAVVIYDRNSTSWATRVWWLFREYGFGEVAILDGGLAAWKAAGLPLETGVSAYGQGDYVPGEGHGLFADRGDVQHSGGSVQLVCALPPEDYRGGLTLRARGGHIPGSSNLPAGLLFTGEGTLGSDEALSSVLAPLLSRDEPIIAYCGSGVSATALAFALARLGRDDVRVYDGSLSEWASDPTLPIATGDD